MTDNIIDTSQRILKLWNDARYAGIDIAPFEKDAILVEICVNAHNAADEDHRTMATIVSGPAVDGQERALCVGTYGPDTVSALAQLESIVRNYIRAAIDERREHVKKVTEVIGAAGQYLEST